MKLSVVMPCYNEKDTIERIVDAVLKADLPENMQRELIIIDDGSNDGSSDIIRKLADKHGNIRAVYHKRNSGKGAALRSGFKLISGDVVLIQDADLEYSPKDYRKLLAPVLENKADVVIGSRFISGESRRVLLFWHSLGNKVLTLLTNISANLNLSDIEVGYKVMKRSIADKLTLKENKFGIEPELILKIARLNCRIYEVGISYNGRTYGEGKKIRWHDAINALWVIFKYGYLRLK